MDPKVHVPRVSARRLQDSCTGVLLISLLALVQVCMAVRICCGYETFPIPRGLFSTSSWSAYSALKDKRPVCVCDRSLEQLIAMT